MHPTPPSALLTAKDVARYFQVSVRTIRRWQRKGHLPVPWEIGGSLRWRATDIEVWLSHRKPDTTTASPNPGMILKD